MKYGVIFYKDTTNFGDDIQSYAAARFLPHVNYHIDRENLHSFKTKCHEKVAVIGAGWYLYETLNWPPSPYIKMKALSMHFTKHSKYKFDQEQLCIHALGRDWFLRNSPIGARDEFTLKMLERNNIPSYLSGCITLTLKRFDNITKHNKILLVDAPNEALQYVARNTAYETEAMNHIVDKSYSLKPFEERMSCVEERLQYYQGARLIITTRLHAALPCLALNVPCLLINNNRSMDRFSTFLGLVNSIETRDLLAGKYDLEIPQANPNGYHIFRDKITKECEDFIRDTCEKTEIVNAEEIKIFKKGMSKGYRYNKILKQGLIPTCRYLTIPFFDKHPKIGNSLREVLLKLRIKRIINTVRDKNLSYLSKADLLELCKQVKNTNELNGIIIEAGCALGGSSIVIAKAKANHKKLYVYDVFEMIPPPSDNDGLDVMKRYEIIKSGQSTGIGSDTYYGYKENLLQEIKDNFSECGIEIEDDIIFIKGMYQETLKITEPVSFAHIDCDWYDSVLTCLNEIVPNLEVGGKIIIDDYNCWSGCKKAVDEYFSDAEIKSKHKLTLKRKMMIERIRT